MLTAIAGVESESRKFSSLHFDLAAAQRSKISPVLETRCQYYRAGPGYDSAACDNVTRHSYAQLRNSMSTLLPFHRSILSNIHDPATSDLLVIARGLGLRRILSTLLKIYDSPQSLILLLNATPEDEVEIGEELSLLGCRNPGLRIVGYEAGTSRVRKEMYRGGGVISVTSRILVVDMLQGDIEIEKITGLVVLRAEKCVFCYFLPLGS